MTPTSTRAERARVQHKLDHTDEDLTAEEQAVADDLLRESDEADFHSDRIG